jgi:tRNA U34 5-methylaminomethyl-2-thiouridine-forming methyltransferase MnmC
MKRTLLQTADGSHTFRLGDSHITYHSAYGAIMESRHVYINAGLKYRLANAPLNIFEMGFGTGLNALLTMQEANVPVYYQAAELYPLTPEEYSALNYDVPDLHKAAWEKDVAINNNFTLHKTNQSILTLQTEKKFDLIYYDAFAPSAQPELWDKDVFAKLFSWMNKDGVLVTYCSKGDVRRAMLAVGFKVEKLKGPFGKREMLRATT